MNPLSLVVMSAVYGAGLVAAYVAARRKTASEIAELRQLVEAHISGNGHRPADPVPAPTPAPAQPKAAPAPGAPVQPAPAPVKDEEVSAETLAILAATVAAYLGKTVRIKHARLLQPTGQSPWATQGRVYIQASHNLAHH